MLLSEYLTDWLSVRSYGLAPRTLSEYQRLIRVHINPVIGDQPLDELTPLHISHCLAPSLSAGHVRTAQLVLVLLRSALKTAVNYQMIPNNPAMLVSPPRSRPRSIHYWDIPTTQRFLSASVGSPYYVAWLLCLSLGLRRGEVCGLRWSDIDFTAHQLTVINQRQYITGTGVVDGQPKSRSGIRTLSLPQPVTDYLSRYRKSSFSRLRSVYIVTDPQGQPINPRSLYRALRRDCVRAGVPPISPHALRHTMATSCITLGVNAKVLQAILGHASYATTANYYCHVPDAAINQAVTTLSANLLLRHA